MKLRESNFKLETSGEFSTTDFKIEGRYKNKVLWMLINQYRYKVRTPVQEIVSNARDAQRENGNPDTPIKIQLPTRLESTFKVRDYGVGMSEERIKTIFTSFGASTKNADNSQTGGFGIGAKSPLTYTDQFNIKTFIDGTYWYYVVAKTTDEGIAIHLLAKGETGEPNGTEVQIPVDPSDRDKFIQSACRCTMFWDVQPEFNLSEEDRYNHTNGIYLDNVSIHTNSELGGIFDGGIVLSVDGIPYKLDRDTIREVKPLNEISNKLNYSNVAVIKLNVGDIDLLQTRENIEETEYTLSQLRKIGLKALTDVEEYLSSCYTAKDLDGRIEQHRTLLKNFRNVKHHSFAKVFKLMDKSVMLADNLKFYGYAFKGKWGARVKSPQKKDNGFFNSRWGDGATFNYTDLNRFYWDDLKDSESSNQKARRLRNALIEFNDGQIVVIERGNATAFEYIRTVRMLGAKPLSRLPLPSKKPRVARPKGAKKLKPEELTIHKLNSYGTKYPVTINYRTNSIKFVYVDFRSGFEKWHDLIKNYTNYTPIKLSRASQRVIEGDTNFIDLEAFKANFKPSQELIKAYIEHFAYSFKIKSTQNKAIVWAEPYLADKVLLKAFQVYNKVDRRWDNEITSFPTEIKEVLEKETTKQRADVINTYSRLCARLDSYPMLELVEELHKYERNERKIAKHKRSEGRKMAQYINTINRERNKRRF